MPILATIRFSFIILALVEAYADFPKDASSVVNVDFTGGIKSYNVFYNIKRRYLALKAIRCYSSA